MLIILFIYQNINVNLEATEIVDVIHAKREQQGFRRVNNYTRELLWLTAVTSVIGLIKENSGLRKILKFGVNQENIT